MPKIEEGMKEGIVKDGMLKIIRGSEAVALQAVESTAAVLRTGLTNAGELGERAGDVLLNTARRAINAGCTLGSDLREATENMVKGTIHTASEIGSEIKGSVSTVKAASGKSEEKAKEG